MSTPAKQWHEHFGLNNIPFGIASSKAHPRPQSVSRYENNVIFLADLLDSVPEFKSLPLGLFTEPTLNSFAALGRPFHRDIRSTLQTLIGTHKLPPGSIEDVGDVQMHLPVSVGDFTDFSCSRYHNLNAGHAMSGRRGLPPTWGFIPPGTISLDEEVCFVANVAKVMLDDAQA